MLELKSRPTAGNSKGRIATESGHSSKLLLALVVLLVAIGALLVMDRQFWFSSNPLILDSDGTETAVAPQTPTPGTVTVSKSATAPVAKKHIPAPTSVAPKAADSSIVATNRTVLPPLDVEIVAGDAHRTIHPAGGTTKVETRQSGSVSSFTAPTNAAQREGISTASVQPQSYPLLAQHMNVQGSVILQAVIGADGIIQDLRVVSGPAILAAAAQQAVREWRFKPVVRNGQAVETKADIVVNFTIKVNDNADKTTVAESRSGDLLIFSR